LSKVGHFLAGNLFHQRPGISEEKMTLAGIKRRLGTACSNRARKSGWFKMTIAGSAPVKLF
jgi:hypothetical protein